MTRLVYLVTEDWYFVSHRLPLARAAQEAGYEVFVLSRRGAHSAEIERTGIEVLDFSMARRGLNPLGLIREVWALARIYRRLQPDIVHHVALRPVVVGGLAARLAGIRAVVSAIAGLGFVFTGEQAAWLVGAVRVLLRVALQRGQVIVQNPDDARAVSALGVAQSRITLIAGAGVDLTLFKVLPEPEGTPVVMLAARLLWDKGVGEFVEAARQLRGRARFVLVGAPDPDNPATVPQRQIDSWVQEGVVEYWGVSRDMHATLPRCHVFCLPSYREGLPKVLLEAMACGRACVTTDAPGCRDAVVDGDSGLVVPPRDAGALVRALAALLGEPALRRRMGRAARARVEREFGCDQVHARTLEIYAGLKP